MSYEPFVGFGTRKGIVFELDQYGFPLGVYEEDLYGDLQPTTDPYTGLEIYGVRSFDMTYPEPRRIPHYNGDRVELVQQLPATEAASGTIVVDGNDLNLTSILGAVKKFTVSGMELMPHLTDQQGNEPNVGLLVYQAAKRTNGVVGWHVQFIASTTMVPRPGPFGDNNYETRYALAPNSVINHLWGDQLTLEKEGAESAGVIDGFALHKPRITTFVADGSEDIFTFKTNEQPSDALYNVYKAVAGVVTAVTSGITKGTADLVFAVPPADGAKILVPHMIV